MRFTNIRRAGSCFTISFTFFNSSSTSPCSCFFNIRCFSNEAISLRIVSALGEVARIRLGFFWRRLHVSVRRCDERELTRGKGQGNKDWGTGEDARRVLSQTMSSRRLRLARWDTVIYTSPFSAWG